jgi:hypothetical protein
MVVLTAVVESLILGSVMHAPIVKYVDRMNCTFFHTTYFCLVCPNHVSSYMATDIISHVFHELIKYNCLFAILNVSNCYQMSLLGC